MHSRVSCTFMLWYLRWSYFYQLYVLWGTSIIYTASQKCCVEIESKRKRKCSSKVQYLINVPLIGGVLSLFYLLTYCSISAVCIYVLYLPLFSGLMPASLKGSLHSESFLVIKLLKSLSSALPAGIDLSFLTDEPSE